MKILTLTLKWSPDFRLLLVNLTTMRPQIFPAAQNFMRPLLCFAAEIFASWQHCEMALSVLYVDWYSY
jgi:hypothetical protein